MNEHSVYQEMAAVPSTAEDRREAYQPPELRDLGSVTELTRTGHTNPGADGLYS
jgi:hypothetical protein